MWGFPEVWLPQPTHAARVGVVNFNNGPDMVHSMRAASSGFPTRRFAMVARRGSAAPPGDRPRCWWLHLP